MRQHCIRGRATHYSIQPTASCRHYMAALPPLQRLKKRACFDKTLDGSAFSVSTRTSPTPHCILHARTKTRCAGLRSALWFRRRISFTRRCGHRGALPLLPLHHPRIHDPLPASLQRGTTGPSPNAVATFACLTYAHRALYRALCCAHTRLPTTLTPCLPRLPLAARHPSTRAAAPPYARLPGARHRRAHAALSRALLLLLGDVHATLPSTGLALCRAIFCDSC